jgi:hypothetical protein
VTKAQKCYDLVKEFFNGDPKKTIDWFHEFNPLLGYSRPIEMINNRRSDKLLMFIKSALSENKL